MNITELAEKTGMSVRHDVAVTLWVEGVLVEDLQAFADLVLEEAAKACEAVADRYCLVRNQTAELQCAAEVRAMKAKP